MPVSETKTIHTKFGSATLNKKGYYQVYSVDKGNHNKLLHRLIFEDFYGIEIPNGFVVHHKNGIKTDNCILNLQLVSLKEHSKLHNSGENNVLFGKNLPLEYRVKISNSRNTCGYFRVSKQFNKRYKQGFIWVYQFIDENGKHISVSSVDIEKLKQKVLLKGWEWLELDEGDVIAS